MFSLFLDAAFEMVILTFLVRSANFSDDMLSSFVPSSVEQFTITDVLKRPVRESLSSLVNFESLKGMC